ncbi:uncharacterized protein K489DRAFT_384970 [Dissoconium aciculare CBS 342.82]|uniref:PH domain-containing protein n=1 Tax=Dissoconium aciculare CBS 342.82 TaxID=1314786 RepID=A0A6J3LRV9_9PEZI|nr:uncharacterized protein K489DRAFT_384970 [Dissoconium aciculare CBS 342.82]KAF1818358.1 hypothetical protein K489DRAFT_384970 [Dissoconium aciculare CBS 342.82]
MSASTSLLPGAAAANGTTDPFTTAPPHAHPAPLRYSAFDSDDFSAYSTNSPSSARRALEAHLKDTERRIQDASRLGTTLLQQRKDLVSRIKDVEQIQTQNEVPADLRDKLLALEREYNEVGRESARAFLPKSRITSEASLESSENSSVLSAQARESPTKQSVPSRRQRNQPSNRVHDIEFATEISTSLIAQVRQLQAALAEKDNALKDNAVSRAQLEKETMALVARIRHMDETEQKYKDENWNLEMRVQELEASYKQSSDKESRLAQSIKAIQVESAAKERELDELKLAHEKLVDDQAMARKVSEADMHGLRRDLAHHENDKQKLHGRIHELTTQNTELAKAVGYRWNQSTKESDTDFVSAEEGQNSDDQAGDHSDPSSPIKGTPARHGMLESETLKSSLNHAHRMIQNLKNNIHREKTEKIELKRMLQDARDELETRRDHGSATANVAKKRRDLESLRTKNRSKPDKIGAIRGSTTEIVDEQPDWEDDEDQRTPSKSNAFGVAAGSAAIATGAPHLVRAYTSTDTETDAFETADERNTTTESEAFATGAEDFDNDTEGDMTETEAGPARTNPVRVVSGISTKRGDRRSFTSTASVSADEDVDSIKTPIQSQQPKYKVRLNRGSRRMGRGNDAGSESPVTYSPASSFGTPGASQSMQNLEDELGAFDDEDSVEGTPSSIHSLDDQDDSRSMLSADRDFDDEEPTTPSRRSGDAGELSVTTPTSVLSPQDVTVIKASPNGTDDSLHEDDVDSTVLVHPTESVIYSPPKPVVPKPAMVDAGIMTEPWQPTPEKSKISERVEGVVGGALAGLGLGSLLGSKKSDEKPEAVSSEPLEKEEISSLPATITSSATEPATTESAAAAGATTRELSEPVPAEPVIVESKHLPAPPVSLTISSIMVQELEPESEPEDVHVPLLPRRSSRRVDPVASAAGATLGVAGVIDENYDDEIDRPGTARSVREAVQTPVKSSPASELPATLASSNAIANQAPVEVTVHAPLSESANVKQAVVDEGSQTVVSSQEIDKLLDNRVPSVLTPPAVTSMQDAGNSPIAPPKTIVFGPTAGLVPAAAASVAGVAAGAAAGLTLRRPNSAGSTRSRTSIVQPPLPADHTEKIAAAASQQNSATPTPTSATTIGSMGPPTMPASAYKTPRPRTPGSQAAERGASRDGTTPRPGRAKVTIAASPSVRPHRDSVSTFASELDDRFNISREGIYPTDVEPSTDPRMIQAITQTMIGEYLWKYTRKTGRNETSSTRHRRFFWVHPYTRTLYWSENDPSTAGRSMLKAKSVAIDAVRVITDDHVYPPGLHRKSLVVVTPGREIVFTAPSSQRHETWYNALSYLLLKTEEEEREAALLAAQGGEDGDGDPDDSRAGFGRSVRRSLNRATRSLSRHSQGGPNNPRRSSFTSRASRTSSPQRSEAVSNLVHHNRRSVPAPSSISSSSQRNRDTTTTALPAPPTLSAAAHPPRNPTAASREVSSGSVGGRFSSLASRFGSSNTRSGGGRASAEPPRGTGASATTGGVSSAMSGSYHEAHGAPVGESAEDIRTQLEMQERNADLLENVRACCDGKHDVGSLSNRTGGRASFGSRFGGGHSHSHPHPPSQNQQSDTTRSRT